MGQNPPVGKNGVVFVDVKVAGRWKGGLAINSRGEAVGIRWGGEWIDHSPSFSTEDVQMIRKASLWNRFLSETPAIVLWVFPVSCLFFLPLIIFASSFLGSSGLVLSVLLGAVAQRLIIERWGDAWIERILMLSLIFLCQTWALFEIFEIWKIPHF